MLDEKVVGEEQKAGCKTLHDGCKADDEGILEIDERFLDDHHGFLEVHGNSLEEKVIVLSDHAGRRKRKEVSKMDHDK